MTCRSIKGPSGTCASQHFICRPGNVCHVGQQMSVVDLCLFNISIVRLVNKGSVTESCFQHLIYTLSHLSHVGQQIVHQELACFNLHFLTDVLECIHGEVYLGYVMTSS